MNLNTPVDEVRFILLDSETTGLDPRKDRLITIGAVAVIGGEIVMDDFYESMLKVAHNTSAVTVHGITRDEAEHGLDEPVAIAHFREYVKDGVIVGHHIGHDVDTFNAAYERDGQEPLSNVYLDTMDLALHLEKDGAFANFENFTNFSLDALCDRFGVIPHDRHTAAGDAFITAQVFLRLLAFAKKVGRTTLGQIAERFIPEEEGPK